MDKLINNLKVAIEENSSYLSVIAKPKMLLSSLCDLNNMIGNDDVKNDVAGQIVHLIANKRKEAKKGKSDKPVMLHSLLYGPPGVGKTTMGIHLARIWYSLGYIGVDSLNRNYESSSDTRTKNMIDEIMKGNSESMMYILMTLLAVFFFISIMAMIIGYVWRIGKLCCSYIGVKWFLILVNIILLLVIITFIFYGVNSSKKTTTTANSDDPEELIKIVSAEDFIGQYVGWTEKKTTEILQSCKGKVLFIDEAYNLASGGGLRGGSFGEAALGIINRYMSEHPEELIVIMAGYKDKMQSLFNVQPGLISRFMWSFNCKGYTTEELFIIWKQQLLPWKLDDEEASKELFLLNGDIFTNYARDTSKLVNYCLIEHDGDMVNGEDYSDEEILTINQIERGIETLRRNTVKDVDSEKSNLMDILKNL